MIKQAIMLRASYEVDPIEEMTDSLGDNLIYLLSNEEKRMYQDWDSALYEMQLLMTALLELLAKPGVLTQINEHYQKSAATKIRKLISFFECINDERTIAFLDHTHAAHADDKSRSHTYNYYDFSQRESATSSYFSEFRLNREQEQKAISYFEVNFANK